MTEVKAYRARARAPEGVGGGTRPLAKMLVVAVLACLVWLPVGALLADDGGGGDMLSERTFSRLERIYELIDEEEYEEARSQIEGLLERVANNEFEKAFVLQLSGNLYIQRDDFESARDDLVRAYELDALGDEEVANVLDNIFMVYAQMDEFDEAVEWGKRYVQHGDEMEDYTVDPDRTRLVGQLLFELDRLEDAITWFQDTIERRDEPSEQDHRLLLGGYFELERFDEAVSLLETMVGYWPEDMEYWENLYGINMELEREEEALDALAVAHRKGLFDESSHFISLYQVYMLQGAPYEAGHILAEGIERGIVEADADNLSYLSRAWLGAREWDRAIEVLADQAEAEGSGEPYFMIAQIEEQRGNWEQVIQAAERSYEMGGFDRPYRALLRMGSAHFNLRNFDEAVASFELARNYEDAEQQASEWIELVNEEEAVLAGS